MRLTVPRSASAREIERVLSERREWIELQRRRQVPELGLERVVAAESELRAAARRAVSELAAAEAVPLGVRYARIRIGGQRTVWGSCSARRTLSFNWRLVLAPASVLDYVVVHELCHLAIPNHSKQFWSLVEGARPGWRDAARLAAPPRTRTARIQARARRSVLIDAGVAWGRVSAPPRSPQRQPVAAAPGWRGSSR